ncbi:endocuticle structural glycoprotein SgAbd-8-like [Formica exsecta]|uniref:endocuticle structural glycoprotein SgAbd-8-like n=1 Tax=Formica exsecta TaxID=72781 RepID=UPI0011439627|nr:endocuticle structural glycoprotein SgAbd-8-like [Formica exsecta]
MQILSGIPEIIVAIFNRDNFIFEIYPKLFLVFEYHYDQGKWGLRFCIKAHSGLMAITLDISSRRISRFETFDKMKFLVVSLALVAVVVAQHQQQPVAILRQAQDISPEGSYNYAYETENGISASEQGSPQPVGPKGEPVVVAQGQYQYTAPDGTPIAVSYSADENGYHPQGAHLPVAPPVPEQIQRAVDYVLAHPQPENLNKFIHH